MPSFILQLTDASLMKKCKLLYYCVVVNYQGLGWASPRRTAFDKRPDSSYYSTSFAVKHSNTIATTVGGDKRISLGVRAGGGGEENDDRDGHGRGSRVFGMNEKGNVSGG